MSSLASIFACCRRSPVVVSYRRSCVRRTSVVRLSCIRRASLVRRSPVARASLVVFRIREEAYVNLPGVQAIFGNTHTCLRKACVGVLFLMLPGGILLLGVTRPKLGLVRTLLWVEPAPDLAGRSPKLGQARPRICSGGRCRGEPGPVRGRSAADPRPIRCRASIRSPPVSPRDPSRSLADPVSSRRLVRGGRQRDVEGRAPRLRCGRLPLRRRHGARALAAGRLRQRGPRLRSAAPLGPSPFLVGRRCVWSTLADPRYGAYDDHGGKETHRRGDGTGATRRPEARVMARARGRHQMLV